MNHLLFIAIFISISIYAEGSFYQELDLEELDDDAGKPLFLTPFVESGKITEGRSLARVRLTERLRIKSYAGYFTVNKTYDSNQFFWYFPAIAPDKDAPVIVWLEGDPGETSLYGLFKENGPLKVRRGKIERKKYSWALTHHVIYIDNPVGSGFSFTKDEKGYCTDETQVGRDLYSTVNQFLQLFPELITNKLFVTGESYGGKYVPALAYTIHKRNPTANLKINLKGIAIGNGLMDPEKQLDYGKYLQQIGLIDWNQAKVFEEQETKTKQYIQQEEWEKAFESFNALLGKVFVELTGFHFFFNYLFTNDYTQEVEFKPLVQTSTVRKAIHVGDQAFSNGSVVETHLMTDYMKPVTPWLSELLDHYNVLIYNGQLDIMASYPVTVNYLKSLNFTGSEDYATAERYQWKVDGEIAGYVKQVGNLVEVMVRNAGQLVLLDQPKWALDLITRFTHGKTFCEPLQPHLGY